MSHRGSKLGSVQEMGVKMLVARDSIFVQESSRDIAGTRAMGGDSESHKGGILWVSFTVSLEQGQEDGTGFGGYGRQGGSGFRQSKYVIDQRFLGMCGQNVSGHESIS